MASPGVFDPATLDRLERPHLAAADPGRLPLHRRRSVHRLHGALLVRARADHGLFPGPDLTRVGDQIEADVFGQVLDDPLDEEPAK